MVSSVVKAVLSLAPTSHQLLLVVEAVSLNSGDLQFMLLDDFL